MVTGLVRHDITGRDRRVGRMHHWCDTQSEAEVFAELLSKHPRYFDLRVMEEVSLAEMPGEQTETLATSRAASGDGDAVQQHGRRCAIPKLLTGLTIFLAGACYSFNVGVLWIWGGKMLASDHIHAAFREWPVLPFMVACLYAANVREWIKEYPWVVLVATWLLSHLTYPLFEP